MPAAHQPAHHVGAHPAEPDHSQLHACSSQYRSASVAPALSKRVLTSQWNLVQMPPALTASRMCQAGCNILPEMHPQRAASAFGEHLEIAARLRGFHNAEGIFLPGHRKVTASSQVICRNTPVFGPPL